MPRPYPSDFRFRAVALVRGGKPITAAAYELGISADALHTWVRQDQVDRGERPSITRTESAQLTKANKRIRQLEVQAEVEIFRTAAALFGENRSTPEGFTRCSTCSSTPCRGKGLLPACWRQQTPATASTDPADVTVTDALTVAHRADRRSPHILGQIYGSRRLPAELTRSMDMVVSENLVSNSWGSPASSACLVQRRSNG
ncbi:transposase [Rhodococcus sp. NPDC057135]|uniref:transposase n=1 Tax=Rhodococcus sp. NPDC057135 TaxID=3346028 RepID=UPI00364322D1